MAEEGTEAALTERQRFWLEHVRAWERSGGAMKTYAAAHGLKAKEFYHWKRWLGEKGLLTDGPAAPPLFHRVVVEPQNSAPTCRIELPNGVRVELVGPLNAALLGAVFKAAGALP